MCGIVGFFSEKPVVASPIVQMNRLLRHRGPDDEGYLLRTAAGGRLLPCRGIDTPRGEAAFAFSPESDVAAHGNEPVRMAFGHRRLAIVDLTEAGHQPMCTPDRRLWIVYNGEIYNHVELRQRLTACGHRFLGECDTEVILAAYQQWGSECLHQLKGMFAFAIYDAHADALFLARDRFGIKPLYYWAAPNGVLCFASEIKALTAFPGWHARLNAQRAYDFLVWSVSDHTDETLFAGVYQLRPGHCAMVTGKDVRTDAEGRIRTLQWYDLQPQDFTGDFADASAQFRERFCEAVQQHLRADVAVGSCLSGGLDSSSIVCAAHRLLASQGSRHLQVSYSACARDEAIDERKWVEQVVASTGIDAHYVYPDVTQLLDQLERITWHQDEPFGSTSIFAQWCVFRQASGDGVKVMLDGQGADELLAGYHAFFGPRLAGMFLDGRWASLLQEMRGMRRMHGYSTAQLLMRAADAMLPERLRQPLRAYAGKSFANPSWLDLDALGARQEDPFARRRSMHRPGVMATSLMQLTSSNLQMLLHFEDRDSMAHSIESRVPFLDHELVEFSLGLPDEYKLSRGVTKRVQRAAMDGILPAPVRDRVDKIAFQMPEETWMRHHGAPAFRDRLAQAAEASQGILTDHALAAFQDMESGKSRYSSMIWRMVSFGEWIRTFSVDVQPVRESAGACAASDRLPAARVA
ncbi:MAG: asparagine synthase (glutamine-hydrolyzing) [Bacillota bacterium]